MSDAARHAVRHLTAFRWSAEVAGGAGGLSARAAAGLNSVSSALRQAATAPLDAAARSTGELAAAVPQLGMPLLDNAQPHFGTNAAQRALAGVQGRVVQALPATVVHNAEALVGSSATTAAEAAEAVTLLPSRIAAALPRPNFPRALDNAETHFGTNAARQALLGLQHQVAQALPDDIVAGARGFISSGTNAALATVDAVTGAPSRMGSALLQPDLGGILDGAQPHFGTSAGRLVAGTAAQWLLAQVVGPAAQSTSATWDGPAVLGQYRDAWGNLQHAGTDWMAGAGAGLAGAAQAVDSALSEALGAGRLEMAAANTRDTAIAVETALSQAGAKGMALP